jgi:hypothetical protein
VPRPGSGGTEAFLLLAFRLLDDFSNAQPPVFCGFSVIGGDFSQLGHEALPTRSVDVRRPPAGRQIDHELPGREGGIVVLCAPRGDAVIFSHQFALLDQAVRHVLKLRVPEFEKGRFRPVARPGRPVRSEGQGDLSVGVEDPSAREAIVADAGTAAAGRSDGCGLSGAEAATSWPASVPPGGVTPESVPRLANTGAGSLRRARRRRAERGRRRPCGNRRQLHKRHGKVRPRCREMPPGRGVRALPTARARAAACGRPAPHGPRPSS